MITKIGKITFDGEDIYTKDFHFEDINTYQEMIDDLLNYVTETLNNARSTMPELKNVSEEDLKRNFGGDEKGVGLIR